MLEEFKKNLKTIARSLPYLWDNHSEFYIRTRTIYSTILTALISGINVSSPIILKSAIDMLGNREHTTIFDLPPIALLISYGSLWTTGQILTQHRSNVMEPVIQNAACKLSLDIIKHLYNLPLDYHKKRKTGAIIENIEKSLYSIGNLITNALINTTSISIDVIAATIIMSVWYGYKYSLSLGGILALYALATALLTTKATLAQIESNKVSQIAISRIIDGLLNYETIQYFNSKNYELQECNTLLKKRAKDIGYSNITANNVLIAQCLSLGLGITLLTTLTGMSILADGDYDVSDFILINTYLLQFVWPLNSLGYFVRDARRALTDLFDVFDLLDEKSDRQNDPAKSLLKISECKLTFSKVCFNYENGNSILNNISFETSPGKTLAIVGENSVGKSTLANLLFRFYTPASGKILIDGQDIQHTYLISFRNHIAIIPQEILLFDNTIWYNIKYGSENATDEEIYNVSRKCGLDRIISKLPQKYDTLVGERGLMVSGGTRQLIGIARAILKNPLIYVFDEPTSSLSIKSEKIIRHVTQEISKSAIVIIIAHRLSTILHADEIIVLDKGRIIERGRHEELVQHNGYYSRLWFTQSHYENSNLYHDESYLPESQNDDVVIEIESSNLEPDEDDRIKFQIQSIEEDGKSEKTALQSNSNLSGSWASFFNLKPLRRNDYENLDKTSPEKSHSCIIL
jgi:ABC-type transport system involved in Fe-S cluster assembly fused permease/ATPase subunit